MAEETFWRRCSACKGPIALAATYWVCNVSTCNRKRTGLVFCTVSCWEVHLPGANHRESWAVERTAPNRREEAAGAGAEQARRRRIVHSAAPAASSRDKGQEEILIIASRLRDYVRAQSGCNTSDAVLVPLSEAVRKICDEAIRNATRDGRRTVLERDVPRS